MLLEMHERDAKIAKQCGIWELYNEFEYEVTRFRVRVRAKETTNDRDKRRDEQRKIGI